MNLSKLDPHSQPTAEQTDAACAAFWSDFATMDEREKDQWRLVAVRWAIAWAAASEAAQ